jgi:Stress responsive A/B Barrel Domain
MIRNITLVRGRSGHDRARMEEILAQLRAMRIRGMTGIWAGSDLGLREGNWDYGIVADLEDAEAYMRYDTDAEHNRIRGELAPLVEQIARSQIEA